jgi:hypothetical protein
MIEYTTITGVRGHLPLREGYSYRPTKSVDRRCQSLFYWPTTGRVKSDQPGIAGTFMLADEAAKIEIVTKTIISELQKKSDIKESQLQKLFRRYAGADARMPSQLKPSSFEAWDVIIFRGSWKKVKVSGITPTYLTRIEDALKFLKLLPPETTMGDRTWLQYLNHILTNLKKPAAKAEHKDQNPDSVKQALSLLLGMNPGHYKLNEAVVGEYFGYRCSSNRGRIVRFHIKINQISNHGILSFDNQYYQDPDHWVVRGCGFDVDALTYLIGHAHAAGHEETGLGLRFFVLSKFRKFGWFVGLLNSLDRNQKPIASRIVLIPAKQHRTIQALGAALATDEILNFISSKKLTASDLDQEIEVPNARHLNGHPVSTVIQSLIWNATLRTLHGANTDIPQKEEGPAYDNVFEFQKKALAHPFETTNDIDFFARLFEHDDVRDLVMSRLPLRK